MVASGCVVLFGLGGGRFGSAFDAGVGFRWRGWDAWWAVRESASVAWRVSGMGPRRAGGCSVVVCCGVILWWFPFRRCWCHDWWGYDGSQMTVVAWVFGAMSLLSCVSVHRLVVAFVGGGWSGVVAPGGEWWRVVVSWLSVEWDPVARRRSPFPRCAAVALMVVWVRFAWLWPLLVFRLR